MRAAIEQYNVTGGQLKSGLKPPGLKEIVYERDDSSSCVVVLGADELSFVNEQPAPQTLTFKMYTNELNGMPTGHRRVSNRYCNTADGERSRQEQMLKNSDQI